jgi:hypothetical protein
MGSMIGPRSIVLHDLRIFISVTEVYEMNVVLMLTCIYCLHCYEFASWLAVSVASFGRLMVTRLANLGPKVT